MNGLFYTILEMSISASILVLVVLLLRLILKKAPKWVNVLLWALVAVRLICPFAIESPFSLMPDMDHLVVREATSYADTGLGDSPDDIPEYVIGGNQFGDEATAQPAPIDTVTQDNQGVNVELILNLIWLSGIAVMLTYMIVSCICVYRRIQKSTQFRDNIYTSNAVTSPFVFGIVKPRIYLPESMDAVSMSYVIAHEESHVRRRDHWWKPLGFILLAVHWFNPIIWLAYILLCRDIEMACDERVIREMEERERVDYSEALLDCSVDRRMITACPLAFGENNVKERIRTVLNYKKPAFWIVILAVIACVVAAICFLTNPQKNNESDITYTRHGIALSLPEAFRQDAVTVKSPDELTENTIAEFYQTAVLDYCGGWIFSVIRHAEDDLVPNEVNPGGIYYFAHDDAYWYAIKSPTDLQTDPTSKELCDEYEMLTSQRDELIRLIMEKNPTLERTSNTEVSTYVMGAYVNKQNAEASSIKEGFGANRIKIKHINSNGQLVNVTLGINLPKEWTINYDYQSYEMIPFAEYADIKNGSDYVGGIGFLTYDLPAEQADIPEAIFNQIAMGAMTFWNIRQNFDVVTAEDSPYRTALTSVLYSSKAFQDGKERSNSGIVSYHPEYKMYIALQLTDGTKDRTILSEEELRYVAESIEWIDVEFSDTGADAANQSELFKKTVDFLAQEYHAVYDPYYQILNLAIFDWNESGNEATFRYTVTQQYWNRDPDTVDYIKAAKDDPERYERMCKDYLAPKESNFFFKVILNGDKIELYSNESPIGVEWKPRKIADYLPNS